MSATQSKFLGTCFNCQNIQFKTIDYHDVTVVDWPITHQTWTLSRNNAAKRKRLNNTDALKAAISLSFHHTSAMSQTDCLHWHKGCPSSKTPSIFPFVCVWVCVSNSSRPRICHIFFALCCAVMKSILKIAAQSGETEQMTIWIWIPKKSFNWSQNTLKYKQNVCFVGYLLSYK